MHSRRWSTDWVSAPSSCGDLDWIGAGGCLAPRRRGCVDRRQRGFELVAQALELWRQHQALAQMRGILVHGKAWAHRGNLEQHAGRVAKVNRLEPVAVDDRRRLSAGRDDAIAPGDLLVVKRGPGNVMNSPGSRHAVLRWGDVVHVPSRSTVAASLPRSVPGRLPSERALEQLAARVGARRVRAHLLEALDRVLGWYLGMRRGERRIGRGHDPELQAKAFRVRELQRSTRPPSVFKTPLPEVEPLLRPNAQSHPLDQPP